MNNRDLDILVHIVRYCDEINEAQERLGNTLESLQSDSLNTRRQHVFQSFSGDLLYLQQIFNFAA